MIKERTGLSVRSTQARPNHNNIRSVVMATQLYQKRDLYKEVTSRILSELEAGAAPWIKPWSATPGLNHPHNAVSNRPYSGCNVVLLWMKAYAVPRYLTFKQALELGGNVRKGEHGTKASDLRGPTENHKILARLPIAMFWTTNYDTLIEDCLVANGKRRCRLQDARRHQSPHFRCAHEGRLRALPQDT
jgi:N-terminal domain of anti-restriction factor ArdC